MIITTIFICLLSVGVILFIYFISKESYLSCDNNCLANNAISKKERPNYLSRSKQVISGTSSVGKLQCHLLEKSNKATHSKFTCPETGKLC